MSEYFMNNLNYYLELNHIRQAELARQLDVSTSTVSDWCSGKKIPRPEKLKAMTDLFHIKYSDLMDAPVDHMSVDEEKIIAKYLGANKNMTRIVKVCKKMPPEKLEHLADFLEAK